MSLQLLSISVLLLAVLVAPALGEDKYVAYVSLGNEKRIVSYDFDPQTGKLTPLSSTDVAGAPGSLAFNAARSRMYASIRSGNSVATFSIDPKSGELKAIGSAPLSGNGTYVILDRSEKYLLAAYYSDNKVSVNALKADGTVNSQAISVMEAVKNPHSIMTDPKNEFVYVPNTGADLILTYRFDPTTGKLAPNEPLETGAPEKAIPAKVGPRHLVMHPTKDFIYFSDEHGDSCSVFARDPDKGTLTHVQTISTLPDGYEGKKNTCADIEITPDGKFVYVSNRGHDSLAGFKVDPATGRLTSIGQTPTEKTPREFTIDPTGNYVLSAGEGNGKLATYKLDRQTGKLTPLEVYEVGKGPSWVCIIKLPGE